MGVVVVAEEPEVDEVTPEIEEYWRRQRTSDPGISLRKASTASEKRPVDPYSPVTLPET